MKTIIPPFVALASLTSLGCGSVEHKSSSTIPPNDPFFVSSLPDGTPSLERRYYCKKGFYIDRSLWSDDELNNIQLGFDMFNEHVNVSNLARMVDDQTSNCRLLKDSSLGRETGAGTEVLADTSAIEYSDGSVDISLSIYSELSTKITESSALSRGNFYSIVVLHETMHTARSGHLPDGKRGVMSAVSDSSISWSADDEFLCESIHACK